MDSDGRGGTHRVRPLAARPLATLVVGIVVGLRADPPGHQRHRAGPFVAGTGRGVVRRRAGGPSRWHARSRGALGRCGPCHGQAWIRGIDAHGGAAGRRRSTSAGGHLPRPRMPGGYRVVRPASAQRRRTAATLVEAATARLRNRTAAGLHAPRGRAPRPDGHRDRGSGRRQYLDHRAGRARPRMDAVRAQPGTRDTAG